MVMNVGNKILVAALGAVAVSVGVGIAVQSQVSKDNGELMTLSTMRSVVLEAENVRDSISKLNTAGAFDREKLLKEFADAKDMRATTLYSTIPVVAAWKAIEKAAASENFGFRVPKHQARNPANKPTAEEEKILAYLNAGDKEEYFEVDRERGLITYARPIRLTADCLACHGDPATSPSKDGLDLVGFPMENWKVGEVHGAFVLSAPVSRVDHVAQAGMVQTILWTLPVTLLVALGFVWLNRRVIVAPLVRTIETIDGASGEAVAASGEISVSSQRLAEGASEQAASLEETSATLEEISSMTKRNADHATLAAQLAEETRTAADAGAHDMDAMKLAMAEIKAASDNIAKINKTIDEIAFQTNLLALNAAVEAARAGEAGAGFAVVAGEVRTLSQRAAEAAKETASKIADAIAKSDHGVATSGKVGEVLATILEKTRRMETVVKEIAAGSHEQSQGIAQVNIAVGEMDKVTQSNAAASEEAAAAAAHLADQASSLKKSLDGLANLVGAHHALSRPIEHNGPSGGSTPGKRVASQPAAPTGTAAHS